MMGRKAKGQQIKLFYHGFSLEQKVRSDHPLRKIKRLIDFDFIYEEVAKTYGINGNVSVPPPVVLKLMLLLTFYKVRSERELMATVPERLDWLWFLDFDIDESIPDHSVLSKAKARWGSTVFENFFQRIVTQCVEAGLVSGKKIFMDSSLIQADASKKSIMSKKSLKRFLKSSYREFESRLDQEPETGSFNDTHLSTTDPDASIVSQGKVRSQPSFKVHRAVDEQTEIITATAVTHGAVNEGHLLCDLIDQHAGNTSSGAEIVVADSQYGTVENYLSCLDRGIEAHITPLKNAQEKRAIKNGLFTDKEFCYDPQENVYLCPAGNRLKCRRYSKRDRAFEYQCLKRICNACPFRDQCTKSKEGRTIRRHLRHDEILLMRERAQSPSSKKDLKKRQHLMERSFARGVRLGFKRARYRGLERVHIQEYLTCCVQNIEILVKNVKEPGNAKAMALQKRGKSPGGADRESGLITLTGFFSPVAAFFSKLFETIWTVGKGAAVAQPI